jgi:hypothetical protein
MDCVTARMSSKGAAWGDDDTNQMQNSFSSISRGMAAFDI